MYTCVPVNISPFKEAALSHTSITGLFRSPISTWFLLVGSIVSHCGRGQSHCGSSCGRGPSACGSGARRRSCCCDWGQALGSLKNRKAIYSRKVSHNRSSAGSNVNTYRIRDVVLPITGDIQLHWSVCFWQFACRKKDSKWNEKNSPCTYFHLTLS